MTSRAKSCGVWQGCLGPRFPCPSPTTAYCTSTVVAERYSWQSDRAPQATFLSQKIRPRMSMSFGRKRGLGLTCHRRLLTKELCTHSLRPAFLCALTPELESRPTRNELIPQQRPSRPRHGP